MKKALYLLFAVSTATFFACGDDSSDEKSNSLGGGEAVTESLSGTLVVDATNQRLKVLSMDEMEMCVSENFDYSWKKVNFGEDTTYFRYEFVDDSLVLYEGRGSGKKVEYANQGMMFTGGSAGDLNGTWKYALCAYDSAAFESICFKRCEEVGKLTFDEEERYNKLESKGVKKGSQYWDEYVQLREKATCLEKHEVPEITIGISGESISETVTYFTKERDFDDFTNSETMANFYQGLFSLSPSTPSFSGLFEEDTIGVKKVVRAFSKLKLAIVEQSKKSITFQIKDSDRIAVNIKTVSSSNEIDKLEMEVSHGETKCPLLKETGDVSKSNCSKSNGEFFKKDEVTDVDDNVLIVANYYSKDNSKEFRNCVGKMMNELLNTGKDFDEIDDDDDCEAIAERYYGCTGTTCQDIMEQYYECIGFSSNTGYDYGDYEYDYGDYDYGSEYGSDDEYSFYKKASAGAEITKEKFIRSARHLARTLERIAK